MIVPGFEKVTACFNDVLRQPSPLSAAQIAVYHHGRPVVDLSGSLSNTPPVSADTPFLIFSISKAFTAMAVLRLVEEGRLELDAPIARYWPEFACGGKEKATLRHALLHQAGIPAPHLKRQVFLWPSWRLVTRNVARTAAQFPPGTQTGYHLVNFGFILGEVVRRVGGMPIDLYLKQTFFEPMGLRNTWMRVPANALKRSPRLFAASPGMRITVFIFNLPVIRRALMPAAGMHSTASELAAFFQMLLDGGEYQGRRYLRPETIALAAQSPHDVYDVFFKKNIHWGMGMIVGGGAHEDPEPRRWGMGHGSSAATFAAFGMGTSMVWADRRTGLVTAFTCNGMLGDPEVGERLSAVSNAVWDSLAGL